MKRSGWTAEEQRKSIGSAMVIATTAALLLGLQRNQIGREYTAWMVTNVGLDENLCAGATKHVLISTLPFAVELCLKGIKSQTDGEFLWTHNLERLWKDLAEAEQKEIRKRAEAAQNRDVNTLRRALGVRPATRTVDQVIAVHQNDFGHWRYVVEGERNLTDENRHLGIDEAIMDLFGIVYACVECYQIREVNSRSPL